MFDKDALTKNSAGLSDGERVLASVVDPGVAPGGPTHPPLFLDQTEGRMAEKNFLRLGPLLISRCGSGTGLDLRSIFTILLYI